MSIFTDVFIKPPRRSKQVLDHPVFTTTDFGKIIPILVEDVVPGDVFKCRTAAEIKLFPTLAPMKQGIEVRIDYFFVPNRLLWKDWQEFITGGEDGTSEVVKPYTDASQQTTTPGSLWDYMGLPPTLEAGVRGNETDLVPDSNVQVDSLPFRAYDLIYNEFYRDETLQEPQNTPLTGGYDRTSYALHYRGYKKDYFTSALPWTQRGPQVTIPLSGSAPVTGKIEGVTDENGLYQRDPTLNAPYDRELYFHGAAGSAQGDMRIKASDGTLANDSRYDISHSHRFQAQYPSADPEEKQIDLSADLSQASAITINELRRLNSVQKWLERNARAGGRYVEQILSHFGVRTPDYRLDRPEYIGGAKQIIGMAEILQTSETGTSPQGSRAGVGFGNMLASSKRYHIDEHGWILGLMSIIPAQNIYADGYPRKYTRTTKFDYYFPEFQNLGEQAILNQELFGYALTGSEDPDAAFGYTPRYAEYRYHPGQVTGAMRTNMAYWHMARLFNEQPTLSEQFISTYNTLQDFDRLFPTDESLGDRFIIYMHHFERLKRPMQKNPNPSL